MSRGFVYEILWTRHSARSILLADMKRRYLRSVFELAFYLGVLALCAGCQSFRWGERTSDDLADTARVREVYSHSSTWVQQPTGGPLPGGPW